MDAIYLEAARQLDSGLALKELDDRPSLEKLIVEGTGEVERLVTYVLDGRIAGVPSFIVIIRRPRYTFGGKKNGSWVLKVNRLTDMGRLYPNTAAFIAVCLAKKEGFFYERLGNPEKANTPPVEAAVANPAAVRVTAGREPLLRAVLPAPSPAGPPTPRVVSLQYRADRIYLDLAKRLALARDRLLIKKTFGGVVYHLVQHHNEDAVFVGNILMGRVEHIPKLFIPTVDLPPAHHCTFHLDPAVLAYFPATRKFISQKIKAVGYESHPWVRPLPLWLKQQVMDTNGRAPLPKPLPGTPTPKAMKNRAPRPLLKAQRPAPPESAGDDMARYMNQVASLFTNGKPLEK